LTTEYGQGRARAPPPSDTRTVEWNFGDGTTINGTLTPTHTYTEAKEYTVSLKVTDDDGGVGIDTLTVNSGVEISIDPLTAMVTPGESTTYNITVHHLGNTSDTYNLELHWLDPAWCFLSSTTVALDPDQTKNVTLTVSTPHDAATLDHVFTVIAKSQRDPTIANYADAELLTAHLSDLMSLREDFNFDGIINILDAIIASNTFGSTPTDPRWNPVVDVNEDKVINIIDMILIASNFGSQGS
jgi:hypothetical protein